MAGRGNSSALIEAGQARGFDVLDGVFAPDEPSESRCPEKPKPLIVVVLRRPFSRVAEHGMRPVLLLDDLG